MHQTIIAAIQNRQVLRFSYNGLIREVEPHCYGVSTVGNPVLRAYQTAGQSESGSLGWKLFTVNQMVGLTTTGQRFMGSRPQYNPNDSAMYQYYARI